MKALSLFSCIGVAELYLQSVGVDVVTASDIDPRRCGVHKFLYPHTNVVCGDICKESVKHDIVKSVGSHHIDMIISTPPCQGMSSVGKNRKKDLKVTSDERNFLIFETFPFIDYFNPEFVVFENVPQLLKVGFKYGDFKDEVLPLSSILRRVYGSRYDIKIDVFDCCNYGVPQTRERVFIRMYKKGIVWRYPIREYHITTLREAIGDLPPLEAGEDSGIKNHWARSHPANQVDWLRHTPTGCSALSNLNHYPVKANGERIKGYPNTYKRMVWDAPSPTVTMRNEIMSSQDKVHPGRPLDNGLWSDARVLTLRELLTVMSMPPDMDLPEDVSDTALRQFIGEGIPPLMMRKIMEGIQ